MRIMIRHVTAASVVGLLLLDSSAMAQTRPPLDAKAWVKEHDRNGDGKIGRASCRERV